jgi:hypothetical protein
VFRPGISVPGFLQVHRNGGLDGDFLVFDHGSFRIGSVLI